MLQIHYSINEELSIATALCLLRSAFIVEVRMSPTAKHAVRKVLAQMFPSSSTINDDE